MTRECPATRPEARFSRPSAGNGRQTTGPAKMRVIRGIWTALVIVAALYVGILAAAWTWLDSLSDLNPWEERR